MAGSPALRLTPKGEGLRDSAVVVAIFLLVLAVKLPGILCPIELGIDESQLLVQAMRYQQDLMPWRSVDGTTSGPLNSWLPLAASYVGLPLNYHGAHLLGALLSAAIVAFSYRALRIVTDFHVAALATGVGVVAIAGAAAWDFQQLTTEQFPAALLALAAWLWLREVQREQPRLPWLMFAAAIVGLVPWAKLQGLPIGAAFGTVMIGQLWFGDAGESLARRVRPALLVVAALAPSVLILGPVVIAGAGTDFWQSYIVGALGYAGDVPFAIQLGRAWALASVSTLRILAAVIVFAAVLLIGRRLGRPLRREERGLFLFGGVGSAAALFACLRPVTHFAHYQFWLIGPLLLLAGALLHLASGATNQPVSRRPLILGGVGALVAVHLALAGPGWLASRRDLADFANDAASSPQRLFAGSIQDRAPRARTMMVWGWMPSLYLESGLSCATRHAIGHFLIDPVPSREHLRQTYLADLKRNQPDVFVDAIATGCFVWYWDVKTSGMESFPELAAYVNEHYRLAGKPTMDPAGTPLRIFVRKGP
jgi:hypothetical protein